MGDTARSVRSFWHFVVERPGLNLTAPQQIRFTEDGFSEDSGTLIYCPGQTESVLSLGLSVSSTGQTRQLENGLG